MPELTFNDQSKLSVVKTEISTQFFNGATRNIITYSFDPDLYTEKQLREKFKDNEEVTKVTTLE